MHRRAILKGLAGVPLAGFNARGDSDSTLVALGREYLVLAHELENSEIPFDGPTPRTTAIFERIEVIDAAISGLCSHTISGLMMKAELANWSRSGNFTPTTFSLDERMAWAIVRDLCSATLWR